LGYGAFGQAAAVEKQNREGDRKGAVMFGDEMIDEASRKRMTTTENELKEEREGVKDLLG